MSTLKLNIIVIIGLIVISFLYIKNARLSTVSYPALIIYIPVIIYKGLPKRKSEIVQGLIAFVAACYLVIGAFFILRFVLCGYGERKIWFENRQNKKLHISGRDFSCFGTTGDLVLYKAYSLSGNVGVEMYYKTFPDYKNITIDSIQWKRITK